MKKIIGLVFISLLTGISFNATSQDMMAKMKQDMQASTQQICNDQQFLSCIDRSSKKCISAANNAMKRCEKLFPTSNAAMGDGNPYFAHASCMDKNLTQNLGVSLDKLNQCDPEAGGDPMAGGMPPMSMEQGIASMNQMLQQHAKSIGTDGVTLPLYKNAIVMSHFVDGNSMGMAQSMGVTPLPALILASSDSMKKIAGFYRKKLSGYKEYRKKNHILFMKTGPKNYDFTQDMRKYMTTPHVLIEPAPAIPGAPPGTKSRIEIVYKK